MTVTMPEQCLLYAGILLYVIPSLLFARFVARMMLDCECGDRATDGDRLACTFCGLIAGPFWPLALLLIPAWLFDRLFLPPRRK